VVLCSRSCLERSENQRVTGGGILAVRVGNPLAIEGWRLRRNDMLDSVRKQVAVPYVPGKVLLSVATVGSFGWLLAHDLVHPVVIYALQLFLSF
jgi:hypothetical protein